MCFSEATTFLFLSLKLLLVDQFSDQGKLPSMITIRSSWTVSEKLKVWVIKISGQTLNIVIIYIRIEENPISQTRENVLISWQKVFFRWKVPHILNIFISSLIHIIWILCPTSGFQCIFKHLTILTIFWTLLPKGVFKCRIIAQSKFNQGREVSRKQQADIQPLRV